MAPDLSSHVHAATDAAPKSPSKPNQQEINPATPAIDDVEAAAGGSPGGGRDGVNYVARAQWLRAAVLGANDGLVTVASLMIGVGAVNQTRGAMLVAGLAGLVSGACSMAIGEFVSVYAQYDIEVAQIERERDDGKKDNLPSPTMAAGASALAFAAGAALPLLAGRFVRTWAGRVAAVCVASSVGLAGFGVLGAYLGGASVVRSGARVLVGGWLAMATTYGVLRLFGMQSA
jgi:VIT1/CCC1 family predicted Fe2+/Mn2+ transporter